MENNTQLLKNLYKGLRINYDWKERDFDLANYKNEFILDEVLRKVYSVGPYCWFLSDMQTGKFIKTGGDLFGITGYTHEEMNNANFIKAAKFTSPDVLSETLKAAQYFWQYFYDQPVEVRMYIKSMYTYKFIKKDGESFHAMQQSSTVFFDKLGNGVFQFDIITNISHLEANPKLRFFILDNSDESNTKNISINPFIIKNKNILPISPSEKRVLEKMALGNTIKEIADILCISENTVKHHRTNMFKKCQVKNMTELVAKALQQGWFNQY